MKVLISDTDSTHAASVLSAMESGYGASLTGEYIIRTDLGLAAHMAYAQANGISLVVRSTTGCSTYVSTAAYYYSDVQLIMPLGSNSAIEIASPATVPVMVTTGAGDSENETGYGPGLEFFAPDPITLEPDASSYSNGYIAGQLLAIKEGRGSSWWSARYAARKTASGSGSRTDADGYGLIDASAAIAYSGGIATDPYEGSSTGYYGSDATEEDTPLAMTSTTKTSVDALTLDPANTEASLSSHASHHDTIHTALQEIYGKTVYLAKLTQSGTGAPTATVIENSTGLTLTWSRTDTGTYALTATTAGFTSGKTFATNSSPRSSGKDFCFYWATAYVMTLITYNAGSAADSLLSSDYVKIEIYA